MNKNDIQIESVGSQAALDAIANSTHHNLLVLDFDETLWLRNSTAEYINSLRPRLLGFVSIALLKIIRPWCWLPKSFKGGKTKDWYLVAVPTILLPWSLFLWNRKAKKLAIKYSNNEIVWAVEANPKTPVIIATLGFNFIINPLLQQMPIEYSQLLGCRFWQGAGDRNLGKLAMVQKILSKSALKSAILVTDSYDDLPLLETVGQPFLCQWSDARYVNPFNDFWLYRLMQKLKTIKRRRNAPPVSEERSVHNS